LWRHVAFVSLSTTTCVLPPRIFPRVVKYQGLGMPKKGFDKLAGEAGSGGSSGSEGEGAADAKPIVQLEEEGDTDKKQKPVGSKRSKGPKARESDGKEEKKEKSATEIAESRRRTAYEANVKNLMFKIGAVKDRLLALRFDYSRDEEDIKLDVFNLARELRRLGAELDSLNAKETREFEKSLKLANLGFDARLLSAPGGPDLVTPLALKKSAAETAPKGTLREELVRCLPFIDPFFVALPPSLLLGSRRGRCDGGRAPRGLPRGKSEADADTIDRIDEGEKPS
jgi:hypothetical protein